MGTTARLRNEHDVMLRLADLVGSEAAAVGRGEGGDLALMRDALRYLTEYPDRFHHPLEDVAVWCLSERGVLAPDAARALDFEHRAVRFHGAQLLQLLEGVLADILLPRRTIAAAGAQYAGSLRKHVQHEERVLLPLLEGHVAAHEWAQFTRASTPASGSEAPDGGRAWLQRLLASIAEQSKCGCAPGAGGAEPGAHGCEARPRAAQMSTEASYVRD